MTASDLEFMPTFFDRYIRRVPPELDLIEGLINSQNDFEELKAPLKRFENHRYQDGKWTPKEILQHLIDNERIQAYRSLVFSREPGSVLPGYDENHYAREARWEHKPLEELLSEFQFVLKWKYAPWLLGFK